MTETSDTQYYEGPNGRVPWMKRDYVHTKESRSEKTKIKVQLTMAWSAITTVGKDIVFRREEN